MTSHYTRGSVTTLHDVWRCGGTAFGHFLLDSPDFMVTALGSCVKQSPTFCAHGRPFGLHWTQNVGPWCEVALSTLSVMWPRELMSWVIRVQELLAKLKYYADRRKQWKQAADDIDEAEKATKKLKTTTWSLCCYFIVRSLSQGLPPRFLNTNLSINRRKCSLHPREIERERESNISHCRGLTIFIFTCAGM